jgi:predicted metalloendopeptidase
MINYQVFFNTNNPIVYGVYSDLKQSDINILHLFTSGLGLPDRDYYFLDSKLKERNEYKKFLKEYASLFNLSPDIDNIYKIEEKLAYFTYTNVQNRDPELHNNPSTLSTILKTYPQFKFIEYLFYKIKKQPGKINITNPSFFKQLNKMYENKEKYTLQMWKDYYSMHYLLSIHFYVSEKIEETYFNFYYKFLSGVPKMKPLWKRVLANVDNQLGFLVGQCYIKKHFNESSKSIALKMIKFIKNELNNRIKVLDWMEESTKIKALNKLNNMRIKVGYPDKWRIYKSDIKSENSYLKNNILCNIDDTHYKFSKLYNKVDEYQWDMNPQEVNAYYSPSDNEIVFPAGILQPPFFSEKYDAGLNFGGIGTVIGHEITHGFDDAGSKYDASGNLNNWWSQNDFIKYKEKTELIKNYFNKFNIQNEFVNGQLTLGENIADLGGLTIALESLKKYLLEHPSENKLIEGLTPIQRVFINYSRVWRSNTRPEEIKVHLLSDPHSPPEFRVNGIVNNIDDFYSAFGIKETSKLYLSENKRAKIW